MDNPSLHNEMDVLVMEQILKAYPGDVMIVDRDYTIVYTNITPHQDLTHEESLLGKKCYHHCRYLQPGSTDCYAKKVFASGKPAKGVHYQLKTGKWIEINGIPLKNQYDEVYLVAEFVTDVTDYKELDLPTGEGEGQPVKERRALSLVPNLVGEYTWYPRSNEMTYSSDFLDMLGYGTEELKPSFPQFTQLVHPKDFGPLLKGLQELQKQKRETFSMEYRIKNADGQYTWVQGDAKTRLDRDGTLLEIKGRQKDISDLKEREEASGVQKIRDDATGLYTRLYFEDALTRLNTERMHPLTLFFVETNPNTINEYKVRSAAHLLQHIFRKEDIVARWDDNTFAIVLPNVGNDVTGSIYNRIVEASEIQGNPLSGHELRIAVATKNDVSEKMEAVFAAVSDQLQRLRRQESMAPEKETME